MFQHQITLLKQLIGDWSNIVNNNPEFKWDLTKGICTNCQLGFDTLKYKLGLSEIDIKAFLEEMYKDFPQYTGNIYYPICTKEEYFPTPQQPPFIFINDLRLELAKHCLNYLNNLKV